MIDQTETLSGRARATLAIAGTTGALAIALVIAAPAAHAQSVTANPDGLQEVTVTARYTEENLQTTPLAITAISTDQLKSANVTNVSSLGALVPNLYTHPGDADEGGAPTIVMRGVVENDASYAREPAVGIYIDDVYHSTVVGSALNLNDLDRVEVKRGPQGTLEGNASIGGSISLYSKLPQETTPATSTRRMARSTRCRSTPRSTRPCYRISSCECRAASNTRTVMSTCSTSPA